MRTGGSAARRLRARARSAAAATACLALLLCAACGGSGGPDGRAEAARERYREIRARAADLEEFFPRMEERLSRERGETLKKSMARLVEEGRRSYDAFIKSAEAARADLEELKSSGGANGEYADSLLALLDANRAEAMLVAEAMLQVDELVRRLPLSDPADFPAFAHKLDELAAGILESREAVLGLEAAAEDLYLSL